MADFTLADISALMGNKEGGLNGGVGWIILLFIFLLAISGNGFFGGNKGTSGDYVTQADLANGLYNQTTDRNLADIRTAQCNDTMMLNNAINTTNYNTLLGFKDMQYQNAQCCCDIKNAIFTDGEATRKEIAELKISELQDKLAVSRGVISNLEQNQYLLSQLGRFYSNPPVNPCCAYSNGTTIA